MGIKSRFCVRCGKEVGRLEDGLCADCYLERGGASLPKKITVDVCPGCGLICWHGLWSEATEGIENYFLQELSGKLAVPEGADVKGIKILRLGENGRVKVLLSVLGKKFEQEYDIDLIVRDRRCADCTRARARTYVAQLQLRFDLDERGRSAIERYKTYVIKIESQKLGVDVYLASKTAAEHLAHELKALFNLRMKRSGQAYGWDQTKNRPKYRLCILLEGKEE
jgi:NMD protein affecting ribosome stability and mRNA decay